MRSKRLGSIIVVLGCFLVLDNCTSGQKAYQRGDYDEAVLKAINRLQRNPNQQKSRETLASAYPATKGWHADNVSRYLQSGDEYRWESVIGEYQQMNLIYDEISRCPGCKEVIPNPISFGAELREAKENAATVRYDKGMERLTRARDQRDKHAAREAIDHFNVANRYIFEFRDTRDRLEEAQYLATWRVIVEPLPKTTRNLTYSQEFFEQKVLEFLRSMPRSEYVEFYSEAEAQKLEIKEPDHLLVMQFDEFTIGQVYVKERESKMSKDSVIIATMKDGKVTQLEYEPRLEAGPGVSGISESAGKTPTRSGSDTRIQVGRALGSDKGRNQVEDVAQPKIWVCHQLPGSMGKRIELQIPERALQTHLNHGDTQGDCPSAEVPDDQGQASETDSHQTTEDVEPNGTDGTPSADSTAAEAQGPQPIYGSVKAKVRLFRKTVSSKGVLDFKIYDAYTREVLTQEKLGGEFIWFTEWGYFNGDERALDEEQRRVVQYREAYPPSTQEMFVAFTEPIYQQITKKIQSFYRQY